MVTTLDRKLLRDVWHLRGQAIAAALVVACGIAAFVSMRTTYHSLLTAQADYYARYRFADIFAPLKRAPVSQAQSIAQISGVVGVRARIVREVIVDVPGLDEPATARLVSIPDRRQPMINDLFIRRGRYVDGHRDDEVLVSEAFAAANRLQPGDSIGAIINGRWKHLRIVGIALSPEFIYEVGTGSLFPDNRRFGVLWMGHRAVSNAFSMTGAFNDVIVTLARGTNSDFVIDRIDRRLANHGGIGAYGREEQVSHRFISDEIAQNRITSTWVPGIFLGVASFLLHIVLSRLVAMQRGEIGVLKAFGYSNQEIGWHFIKLALTMIAGGIVVGAVGGILVGESLINLYRDYYRFPELVLRIDSRVIAQAAGISMAVAVLGALGAVRAAVNLPAAEAMRPASPVAFHTGWMERMGMFRMATPAARMILRNLQRRPVQGLLSVAGIACAVGILVIGGFFNDAVRYLVQVQFGVIQREDVTVLFADPRSASTRHLLERMPGVVAVEPFRSVPVRLRFEHRTRQVELLGMAPGSRLRRLRDAAMQEVTLPERGLVLNARLARILGAGPGDRIIVEVLEGRRRTIEMNLTAIVEEMTGLGAYVDSRALSRLLNEEGTISGAWLTTDPPHRAALFAALKRMPGISGISIRDAAMASLDEILERSVRFATIVNILFASVIAFGVVYNSARISLSERGHELASLRVLGFTRNEVNGLLLGEQALLTLAAIPIGMLLGRWTCGLLARQLDTDLYRIPLVLTTQTFGQAALVVIIAAVLSALLVARRLRGLDLIAVLKTRE